MERLLVLRLESLGTVAEAVLNGVPLGRTGPLQRVLTVPIHEFTLEGSNRLELHIDPAPPAQAAAPEPWLSDGQRGASLRLLLPRVGQLVHPENARTLAQLDWAPVAGEVVTLPCSVQQTVSLPIAFPRWRWLDAPVLPEPALLREPATAFLQGLVLALMRGDPEPLLLASRLRLEELALAYQRPLADEAGRLRQHLQRLLAAKAIQPAMPKVETLVLRSVAEGRLLECLNAAGAPVLSSLAADEATFSWPLRLSFIDGQFYVLR